MTREELIAAMRQTAGAAPVKVKTKQWGTIFVRPVTVAEAEAQAEDTEGTKDKHRLARGAARVICNEKGERTFDPANAEDVALLASQPWPLLRRVLAAADLAEGDDSGN